MEKWRDYEHILRQPKIKVDNKYLPMCAVATDIKDKTLVFGLLDISRSTTFDI